MQYAGPKAVIRHVAAGRNPAPHRVQPARADGGPQFGMEWGQDRCAVPRLVGRTIADRCLSGL